MDLWVFGAAAAAGYVAKHWQYISRDRDSLSEPGKNETPSCPFRRLTWRRKLAEDTSSSERSSDVYKVDGASEAEVSTSCYVEKLGNWGDYEPNILSLSSLPFGFSTDESLKESEGENGLRGDMGDNSGRPCTGEMDSFHDSMRKRISLRTKDLYIKPVSSLQSCLMAQLYEEHAKMEEYVFSAFPSPSATTRPLVVTNGNQTINKVNGNSFSAQRSNDNRLHKEEIVCGVPPLPKISALDAPNKIKSKIGWGHDKKYSNSHKAGNGRHFDCPNGSLDRTIIFCMGICVGIVSSILANRRELDKFEKLLKQKENLVRDLQEELEMKDLLTVKELANEKCEPQDTYENSFYYRAPNPVVSVQDMHGSTNNNGKESHQCEKAEETSEDMSKIEAELEAELERLGLNINTSNLDGELSDLVELDPDFIAVLAEGELREDRVNGRAVAQFESDSDTTGASIRTGNYTVSPRELSLRLHEVIQSRLEERVKKLEMALQNSERKLQLRESEQHRNVWRKLRNRELRYSSDEETEEDLSSMTQPLVMDLSGEALDAYNEAYEELLKINESEEDWPSGVYENNHQVGIHPINESITWGPNGAENGSLTKETSSRKLYFDQLKASIERGSGHQELVYDGASEDENGDCNDELEKQLIKLVVEKTRRGFPLVLNAESLLFSMDENDG